MAEAVAGEEILATPEGRSLLMSGAGMSKDQKKSVRKYIIIGIIVTAVILLFFFSIGMSLLCGNHHGSSGGCQGEQSPSSQDCGDSSPGGDQC